MAPHPATNGGIPTSNNEKLLTVLVTGFGPFQDRFPVNPSYEIARSLPQLLPRSAVDCEAVRTIGYEPAIRVSYDEARELVPALLDSFRDTVDMVLHIGMASGRHYYAAERYAHRDGYSKHKDLDGRVPSVGNVFDDCPARLSTSFDFDDVIRRWQSSIRDVVDNAAAAGADCRPSEDAGHFLCDYTYYNSLAYFGRRNKCLEGGIPQDRPVLFLHVPAESDPVRLERGRAVAVALIRAMADSYTNQKAPR